MQPHQIYQQVIRLTHQRIGVAVNPHLFRDCAATSIALEDPAHVMIIKDVLGHASLATGERHYNQARSVEAAHAWQRSVCKLRRGGRSYASRP
jgi:integrase/recombinase XerD